MRSKGGVGVKYPQNSKKSAKIVQKFLNYLLKFKLKYVNIWVLGDRENEK